MKKVLYLFLAILMVFGIVFLVNTREEVGANEQFPPVYSGLHECSINKVPVFEASIIVDSMATEPILINLQSSGEYLFKAMGDYEYGQGRRADAGYANNGSWDDLRYNIGIFENAQYRGVTSLISDMGTETFGIVEWGEFNLNHEYSFAHTINSKVVKFVISDWWSDWYSNSCNNNSCMHDNSGYITVNIFKCEYPDADPMIDNLGVNRHAWNGQKFVTLIPGRGRINFQTVESEFSITDTRGYTCEQILERMSYLTGESFGGHYKFGCSKSLMEAWIDGRYLVDSLEVPSYNPEGIHSNISLMEGKTYFIKVSGTYRFADWGDYGIADAEYSYRRAQNAPGGEAGWIKGEGYFPSHLYCALDLQVDGCVDWEDFSENHIYEIEYIGKGQPAHFHIFDDHYGDNSGYLSVDIYQKLY